MLYPNNNQGTISTTPIRLLFTDSGFDQAILRKKTEVQVQVSVMQQCLINIAFLSSLELPRLLFNWSVGYISTLSQF